MNSSKAFSDALKKLKSLDGVSMEDIRKEIGVSYDLLRNTKNGKQQPTDELVKKIADKYPQFEKYLQGEPQGGEHSGQTPPDEQAEEIKQIVDNLRQIVEDYAKRNSTLEDWYSQMKEDYRLLNDKYVKLLEELRK